MGILKAVRTVLADHRRPKLGMQFIESLIQFCKLLENGPKYKRKDDLPHCRCVLMQVLTVLSNGQNSKIA